METLLWKGIAMISLIISFVALIIGIVGVDKATIALNAETQLLATPTTATQVSTALPKSCKDVTGKNGLYMIQPDQNSPPFQVYCDMEVNGGKWTLVATVHENNIDGKCTVGDKWSSEQGRADVGSSRNWENKNVFGRIETITDRDYKNPAYYNVPADNVMLWHVPNGIKANAIRTAAYLKYYTNSGFLNKTNLQILYSKTFPLRTAVGGLDKLITRIQNRTANTTGNIPFWYNYRYDGGRPATNIRDGGGDMYDGGNAVSFGTDRENFTTMTYNTPYFLYGSGVEIKSGATGYPFITLAWIGTGLGNVISDVEYFQYRVVSNYGADGRGNSAIYEQQTVRSANGDMSAVFTAFNIANASDPSVCEVYFYITNRRWKSRAPISMIRMNWANQTRDARNIVRFTGRPSNLLIGYTLLSKSRGRTVLRSEIVEVLKDYMEQSADFNFKVLVPFKTVPVAFAKGNAQDVLNSIPTVHRDKVVPGHIQFRAFNSVGLPNALCPGVRVNSDNPEQMCIGGTSTAIRDISQCGDFAGWKGINGDPGSANAPSRTGKSQRDINSTILIFTR